MIYRLTYIPGGTVAANNIECACSMWLKAIGLIGRRRLAAGCGLWLPGIGSIHTFGLTGPIDVLFLDREMKMTSAMRNLGPHRVYVAPPTTRHCIELGVGTLNDEHCRSKFAQWSLEPS